MLTKNKLEVKMNVNEIIKILIIYFLLIVFNKIKINNKQNNVFDLLKYKKIKLQDVNRQKSNLEFLKFFFLDN